MASTVDEGSVRRSTEFVQTSILEATVPSNENVDLEAQFQAWNKQGAQSDDTLFPFLEQRHFLFLDELVPLFIVLRTFKTDADHLKEFLSRLTIQVEAFATGTLVASSTAPNSGEPTSPHPVQAKDLLYSQRLDDVEQPLILAHSSELSDSSGYIYLVWKTNVFIGRPKTRLQKLGIYFAVSASLQTIEQVETFSTDEYLPSGIPTSANLLEAFAGDPSISGAAPHLPISRIMRSAPTTPAARDPSSRPIKSAPRRIFRAGPALAWRIRFTRLPTTPKSPILLASLDLEATSFASCNAEIEAVDIKLVNGRTEPLSLIGQSDSPAICRPGDQYTFLCKLIPGPGVDNSAGHLYALDVDISGAALIADDCKPKIRIKWKTSIDVTPTARPSSSRLDSSGKDTPAAAEPPMSPQNSMTAQEFGVTLTISGLPKVYVGEVFQWNLFVVNRSATPRRLAILVVPKPIAGRASNRREGNLSISSNNGTSQEDQNGIAEAVVDETTVHTQLRRATVEPAELVNLSPDVRIGPLGTSACFTTEIRFLALVKGVLRIESLRLVDLTTQEAVDIRDLPDIVAVERGSGP